MPKCLCGKEIENWEVVCKDCWNAIGKYDRDFGSNFRETIVTHFKKTGRRDVLNEELLEAIKKRAAPRRTTRIRSLKEKMKVHCKECEEMSGKKDIDDCFNCPFHILTNKIFLEILNNGH